MQKNKKTNTDLYATTIPNFNRTCGGVHEVWCKKNEESPINNHNPNSNLFRFCGNIPHSTSC